MPKAKGNKNKTAPKPSPAPEIIAPRTTFARTFNKAFAAEIGRLDEATQETLAETVARRLGQFLRKGRVSNVYRGILVEVRDTGEGRPSQTVQFLDGRKDIAERELHELRFYDAMERWPTEDEATHFTIHGKYPDAQ